MSSLLDSIRNDLGPYWRKEGLDVSMHSRILAHLIAQCDKLPPAKISEGMKQANELLRGHGVEAIHSGNHRRGYWGDIVALYVNMGDTYNATLLYDVLAKEFKVTTMGDWVQEYEQEHGELP
jgi:hypothetical protein